MKQELINFRGVNEGIFINIESDDIYEIKNELNQKITNSYSFYKDTKIMGIKGDLLSQDDIIDLKYMLKYKHNLIVLDEELPKHIVKTDDIVEEKEEGELFKGIDCGITKFVNGTLRSGQVVEYHGNIVIIGDVNPGALIQAKGNIIVLGTLRGVAHAGMGGNLEAIVASYNLQPTQLRIGDVIGRPPDSGMESSRVPEIARIKDNEVTIEPYLPNK